MKPFNQKTPLERAKDHNDQVKRAYYVQNQSGTSSSPSSSSSSSSDIDRTVQRIRELNAQEDAAWRVGNTQAAKELSERAFAVSRSQINANIQAQRKSGCVVIILVPLLSAAAFYLMR